MSTTILVIVHQYLSHVLVFKNSASVTFHVGVTQRWFQAIFLVSGHLTY